MFVVANEETLTPKSDSDNVGSEFRSSIFEGFYASLEKGGEISGFGMSEISELWRKRGSEFRF